jgi:hypothetical protein
MQPTQPIRAIDGRLPPGFPESLAARLLGAGLVEARGNPGVGAPAVLTAIEVLEVPAPLNDGFVRGEHTDETERIHPAEWQFCERRFNFGGRIGRER